MPSLLAKEGHDVALASAAPAALALGAAAPAFPTPALLDPTPPFFAAGFPPLAGEGDWEGRADAAPAPPAGGPAAPFPAAAWLPGAPAPPAAPCALAACISWSVKGCS